MHTTVGYLIAKPSDFKNCARCGAFNWYENQRCITCGGDRFKETTQADVKAYVEVRAHDEHFCDDCEIDV